MMFPHRGVSRHTMVAGRYTEISTGDTERGYVDSAYVGSVWTQVAAGSMTPAKLKGVTLEAFLHDSDGSTHKVFATGLPAVAINWIQLYGPTLAPVMHFRAAGDISGSAGSWTWAANPHAFVQGNTYQLLIG